MFSRIICSFVWDFSLRLPDCLMSICMHDCSESHGVAKKTGNDDSSMIYAHPMPQLFLVYYGSLEGSRLSCSTIVCQTCVLGCPFQALKTLQSEHYRMTLGSIRNQGRSQPFVDLVPGNAGLYVEPWYRWWVWRCTKFPWLRIAKTFAYLGHGEGHDHVFAVSG